MVVLRDGAVVVVDTSVIVIVNAIFGKRQIKKIVNFIVDIWKEKKI